mgnify:CR=1 FL=1
MDKKNANKGSGKPINVSGQRNGMNAAPIVSVQHAEPINAYKKNTANMAAIQADGQRNNTVKMGISKSQTPFG